MTGSGKALGRLKIGGLLIMIPIILASGPFAGFIAGDWLAGHFGFPRYITIVCVIIGFAAAFRETVKVIRLALKTAKNIGEDRPDA